MSISKVIKKNVHSVVITFKIFNELFKSHDQYLQKIIKQILPISNYTPVVVTGYNEAAWKNDRQVSFDIYLFQPPLTREVNRNTRFICCYVKCAICFSVIVTNMFVFLKCETVSLVVK